MRVTRSLSRPVAQALSLAAPSSSWVAATFGLRHAMGRTTAHAHTPVFPNMQHASLFSTSIRSAQESTTSGATDVKKEQESKAAGEAMGATESSGAGAEEGSAGASESSKVVEDLKASLKEKDARIKELTDAVLYTKADLQNAQRRAKEEKDQASVYAITKLARDLTSSIDILSLALRSVPEPLRQAPADVTSLEDPRKAVAELYSGVELTSKSMLDMLKMHGVTMFDPTGEKFNPQEHEAVFQAPVPGKEPGTVLSCSKAGFRIKDRILRAAQVGVVQDQA